MNSLDSVNIFEERGEKRFKKPGISGIIILLIFVISSNSFAANWTPIGLTDTEVFALAIDPQTPDTLYAGTLDVVFKSTDGGTNWTAINTGLPTDTTVLVLAINPRTPDTLYAGTDGAGLFKSTNGGANWTPIGLTDTEIFALAIDPQTPDTLYAGTGGGVFKSTDGGANWTPVNTGLTNLYISAFAIDPQAPQTLYAGTGGAGLFKSTNGGANWTPINNGITGLIYQPSLIEIFALAINPQAPDTLYAGTWGGAFKLVGPAINMSVTTTSVNFGNLNVGQSTNQTITIINQSSSTGNLSGNVNVISPSLSFSVVNGGGAFNLAPGQSLMITVGFSPTVAGAASTNLSITHNATNMSSPINISLIGTGVSTNVPVISVTPTSGKYGNVKVKKSKTASFKVKNNGTANLSILSSTITGTDASMFKITSGSGSKTIKPRKTLTLKVAFKPTSTGSKSAILEITSNDPVTPTIDIPLSGTGQ